MVRIRLKRIGTKNWPSYRVVVTDIRTARDGRTRDDIGYYDPLHKTEKIDVERADYWVAKGAQPSETVADIIHRAKNGTKLADIPRKKKPSKKTVAKQKAAADAAAAAAGAAAPAAEAAKEAPANA